MRISKQSFENLRQFIVEAGRDPDQYDIQAEWDSNLSYEANKQRFAALYRIPYNKANRGGTKLGTKEHYLQSPKRARKEIDQSYCDFLAENCESNCNNGACKVFKKEGCPGSVEPCPSSRLTKQIRKNSPLSLDGCEVQKYCVAAHERPPQHNSRTGLSIKVNAYCVEKHSRLCRRSGYQ